VIRRYAVYSTRGADFKAQRDELGLSLRYVAAKSGYSARYIGDMERGVKPLPLAAAEILDTTFARIRARIQRMEVGG